MEDGHTLFDYDVGLNDIVQLMIRPVLSNGGENGMINGDKNTSDSTDVVINGKHEAELTGDSQCESEEETMDVVSQR